MNPEEYKELGANQGKFTDFIKKKHAQAKQLGSGHEPQYPVPETSGKGREEATRCYGELVLLAIQKSPIKINWSAGVLPDKVALKTGVRFTNPQSLDRCTTVANYIEFETNVPAPSQYDLYDGITPYVYDGMLDDITVVSKDELAVKYYISSSLDPTARIHTFATPKAEIKGNEKVDKLYE